MIQHVYCEFVADCPAAAKSFDVYRCFLGEIKTFNSSCFSSFTLIIGAVPNLHAQQQKPQATQYKRPNEAMSTQIRFDRRVH